VCVSGSAVDDCVCWSLQYMYLSRPCVCVCGGLGGGGVCLSQLWASFEYE